MTRQRGEYDMRLPKNLTFRRNRNAFYWRNPVSKKEISLGQISRREAIAQAIEANHYIEQNYSPVLLLEKIKGSHEYTLNAWLDRYDVLFKRRELAENTYKVRAGQIAIIRERLGDMVLTKITTRHIAEFLEFWIAQNKKTMAATMRSVLSDIFREAIDRHRHRQQPDYSRRLAAQPRLALSAPAADQNRAGGADGNGGAGQSLRHRAGNEPRAGAGAARRGAGLLARSRVGDGGAAAGQFICNLCAGLTFRLAATGQAAGKST